MNKIIKAINEKTNETVYTLITEDGRKFPCTRWFEKKTDKWYIELDKEGREISGRRYISEKYLDNRDEYEFETKTEHREGLNSGGWRSRLTQEELKRLEQAEKTIEELKKIGTERKPVKNDISTEEGLKAEIQRLLELQKKFQKN
jgi:hypothetical protein